MKRKQFGFTIIELAVVIVIVGILVAITAVGYRKTQENARNEQRKTDSAILVGAVEEYRADHGDYPRINCTTGGGSNDECRNNEIWDLLKNSGYLREVPEPGSRVHLDKYRYRYGSSSSYGIYIPLEPGGISSSCAVGKNRVGSWFDSVSNCSF